MTQQFVPDTDAHFQLDVLRRTAAAAAGHGGDPLTVTTRAYDAMRSELGVTGALTTDALRRRFGVPWRTLLELAYAGDGAAERALTQKTKAPLRSWTEEEIVYALQTVAAWRGVDTLRPGEYDETLAELATTDRRAHRHGRHPLREMPGSDLIIRTLGRGDDETGWNKALRLARLAPRPTKTTADGAPAEVAFELFLVDMGWVPSSEDQLILYAQKKRISLKSRTAAQPRSPRRVLPQLAADRAARGLWTPARPPRLREQPEWSLDHVEPIVDPAIPRRRHAVGTWTTEERIVEGLIKALDALPAGETTLRQRRLNALATGNPEIPAYSIVQRYAARNDTTFTVLRAKATRERARRRAHAAATASLTPAGQP